MRADPDSLSNDAITAWARLVRVSQAVLTRVEADLKAAGFPPLAWYDALLELDRVKPDGLRPFQLQERMLLAQYNMSRLTDRLKSAGYIVRENCVDDGRGQVLHITEDGCRLLKSMWPAYRKAIAAHFGTKLDVDETAELARVLEKLR